MTNFEAQALIDNEQKQNYYITSPLNTGEVAILRVGEDGFFYTRETEYMRTVGIAKLLCNNFTVNIDKWRFSEIVVRRKINS